MSPFLVGKIQLLPRLGSRDLCTKHIKIKAVTSNKSSRVSLSCPKGAAELSKD